MFCSVVITLLGMVGVASAQAADGTNSGAAGAPNCQHGNTYGTIVSAAHVMRYDDRVELGSIQLCKDSSSRYWAFVIFYDPVPTGNWGNAYLNRYYNGGHDFFACHSPGGNDFVDRRQTRCWTPKIDAPSSKVTFAASGVQCEGTHPGCTFRQGVGVTARTR
jgi:hypothetical protein